MKYQCIVFLLLLCSCSSTVNTTQQIDDSSKPMPHHLKNFLLSSKIVNYYELPDTVMISDPEELLTFSIPVKNPNHLRKFRILTTNTNQKYNSLPPKSCKPSFNSALVFEDENVKQTILFSLNCGLLFFYQEGLYLDVGNQTMDIETTFREIRSGR
jgi:hypothetical protein